jgi:hypothetical protein
VSKKFTPQLPSFNPPMTWNNVNSLHHFLKPCQVTLCCQNSNHWTSCTETLSGAGVISNALRYSISTKQIHILPELHGASQATLDAPHMYLPDKTSFIASHEMWLLEDITPAEIKRLNYINSIVMASHKR